jgi:hypothetical protein
MNENIQNKLFQTPKTEYLFIFKIIVGEVLEQLLGFKYAL